MWCFWPPIFAQGGKRGVPLDQSSANDGHTQAQTSLVHILYRLLDRKVAVGRFSLELHDPLEDLVLHGFGFSTFLVIYCRKSLLKLL